VGSSEQNVIVVDLEMEFLWKLLSSQSRQRNLELLLVFLDSLIESIKELRLLRLFLGASAAVVKKAERKISTFAKAASVVYGSLYRWQ